MKVKLLVIGIVCMFAVTNILIANVNTYRTNSYVEPNILTNLESTSANRVITKSYLEHVANLSFEKERKWDIDNNRTVTTNYTEELHRVNTQWQLIYTHLLIYGGSPTCCLGWGSNSSGKILLSLVAKYRYADNREIKRTFSIIEHNSKYAVLTKVERSLSRDKITAGKNAFWDGYTFYNQGCKVHCNSFLIWHWKTKSYFNYEISYVSENIKVPQGVVNPSKGVYDPANCSYYNPGQYTPVEMAAWDALSQGNLGSNMIQAGVMIKPSDTYCLMYQQCTGYGNNHVLQMPNPFTINPGNTVTVRIFDTSGTFTIVMCNLNTGGNSCQNVKPSGSITPYYFESVIEAPRFSKASQLPQFEPFEVSQVEAYSNNHCIYSSNLWSKGWYSYCYIQQNPNEQNLNNGWNTDSTIGSYDISLATTSYFTTLSNTA